MVQGLRQAVKVAEVELRWFCRDRVAIFVACALPLTFTFVMGMATTSAHTTPKLGICCSEARGPEGQATALRRDLAHVPRLRTVDYQRPQQLERAVMSGAVTGGIQIPGDYDTALLPNQRPITLYFFANPAVKASSALRLTVQAIIDRQVAASLGPTDHGVGSPQPLVQPTAAAREALHVVPVSTSGRLSLLTGMAYHAPAKLVVFVFLTTMVYAVVVVQSRQQGLFRRLLVAPTAPAAAIAGVMLSRLALGLGQSIIILVVDSVAFGVHWGNVPLVLLIICGLTLAASGASAVLGSVARTSEQANVAGIGIALAIGMIAGCFWPLSLAPHFVSIAAKATPQAWALDGLARAMTPPVDVGGVLMDFAALAAFTAVLVPLGALAMTRAARMAPSQ